MNFQFESLSDFMTMSGHGAFVWISYVVTLLAILLLVVIPIIQKKQMHQQLKRQRVIEQAQKQKLKPSE